MTPSHELELVRYRDLSPRIRSFECRSVGRARLEFEPGQYVSIEFTLDGAPCSPCYSLASSPGDDMVEIVARYNEGAPATRYLWGLRAGHRLRVAGPLGALRLRGPEPRASLFVANGTGIAPVRSMIRWLVARGGALAMTLLYGARDQTDLIYDAEFVELARQKRDFVYKVVLTRPLSGWTGAQGRVQEHAARVASARSGVDAYLAGSPAMVEDLRRVLEAAGFDPGSIYFEK